MLSRSQVAYLMRESVAGFVRRKLTTGVTILIMSSSLLVLAVFTIVTLNLGTLLDNARSSIDLRIFLVDDLTAAAEADLQPRLVAIDGVQNAGFVTRQMALEELRSQLGSDADVLAALEGNPLPTSYLVTLTPAARDAQRVGRIATEVRGWPEVSDVVYGRHWVEALERWNQLFRLASLIVSLVVFAAAVFVISHAVRLTMASQARAIEIMKLVGATDGFVRTPYVCAGVLEGLLAGALAMAVLGGIYLLLAPKLAGLVFFSLPQIAGFVLFCIGLGLVGSWAAIRKYLRA